MGAIFRLWINIIRKYLIINMAEELTKDQKLDKVFWFKVCTSIFFGVCFGIFNMTGIISIIM